ncbi:hypothetical protein [Methyloglobulus sp.]|uniref:hypothetical protein n=1 Tax=Methyloglobulus sp. TaxID=2518622 RepID=UPI00398A228E
MLPVLRKSLIVVLAMLQLFVPLVHGHTGDKSFNQGLHVPGLELYLTHQDAYVFQNVNHDWAPEGLLVVVNAGVKNPQDISVETTGGSFALLPSDQLRITALPENDNNFSPQPQSFGFRRLLSPHSPRAPPAH